MISYPDFYDPERVGTLYAPNTGAVMTAGAQTGLSPAEQDQRHVMLLLVDPQVDFIHPDGSLSVPGAVADTRRTIEWILSHVGELTAIASSLDSHLPAQIFFPTWWINDARQHPAPFTAITSQDLEQHRWQPLFEPDWSRQYVYALETQAKKELMIWPYHTMMGTPGHSITPALYEAIVFHAAARQSPPVFLTKGAIPKTEHYSLLEPEVKVPDQPQGSLNTAFLGMLANYDLIYVAGQAKSHCVLETVTSVMQYFGDQPEQIAKWRILTDCMSSVAHPVIDFDAMAEESFARFAAQGLHLVTSDAPIG